MSLRLSAHWLLYSLLAMTALVAAQVALTGQLAAIAGVFTAAAVLLAGLATTPARKEPRP